MKLANYSNRELREELKRRKLMPNTLKFDFYLHNDYTLSEIQETIENQTDVAINDDLARKVSARFYEVKFKCELDTVTGELLVDGGS